MQLPGEVQSLVDILARMGQDTAGALHGGTEYLTRQLEGDPIPAADALAIGRERTGEDWYQPGPEGEAVNQELLQALAGTVGAVGQSIPGAEHLAAEAGELWEDMPENVVAGIEMIAAPLDITPAALFASIPMGLIRQVKNLPAEEVAHIVKMYHGGPNLWDKPEPLGGHVGTGVQRYGAGMYTSNQRPLAVEYAKSLADLNLTRKATVNNKPAREFISEDLSEDAADLFDLVWSDLEENILRGNTDFGSGEDLTDAFMDYFDNPEYVLEDLADYARLEIRPDMVEEIRSKLKDITLGFAESHVYELDVLKSKVAEMLDWDKRIDQQEIFGAEFGPGIDMGTDKGSKILRSAMWGGETGGYAYKRLAEALGSQKAASEYLRDLGVPGLQQWDPHFRQPAMSDRKAFEAFERHGRTPEGIDKAVTELLRGFHGTDAEKAAYVTQLMKLADPTSLGRNYVIFDADTFKNIKRETLEPNY